MIYRTSSAHEEAEAVLSPDVRDFSINTKAFSGDDNGNVKKLHGIRLDGVINQQRHNREAQARCTKHPPSFGIDLLIDDSEGVRIEGERHGFRMLAVLPDDEQWVQKVRAALDSGTAL